MRKRNNKTNNASTKRGSRPFRAQQLTCVASGRELPYHCEAQNGLSGLLTTYAANPSATNGSFTDINPNYFGARCAQLAQLYNEWRLRKLVVRFRPYAPLGVSYATNVTAVLQQYTGYAGFVLDPTVGALTQDELLETGGAEFNFGRPYSWTLRGGRWLYTQPTVGDTLSDARFFSMGHFNAIGQLNGPNPSVQWGVFEFLWECEFRFPIDANQEAAASRVQVDLDHVRKTIEMNRVPHPITITTAEPESFKLLSKKDFDDSKSVKSEPLNQYSKTMKLR